MEQLSAELLVEVFGYLSLDELLRLHLVCRRWHSISSDRRFRKEIMNKFLQQYMRQLARTSKPETTISNELILNADGTIKATTVEALISECIHHRVPTQQNVLETLVSTWPCLSKQSLIERFLQRYLRAPTDDEKHHVIGLILRIAALNTRDLARAHSRRVVQVLIQLHRLALEPPSQRLVPQLAFAWHEEDAILLANLERHAPRRRPESPPSRISAQHTTFLQLLLDERSLRTLAEQLTLKAWHAYDAISPHDLLNARARPPTVTSFTTQFNQLSYQLVAALLREPNAATRLRLLNHQTQLLGECLALNNFHFGMAIYSALNSRWLSMPSLKALMARLHKTSVRAMEAAERQLSSTRSFQELRRTLTSLEGGASGRNRKACVPYLGLAIMDISFILDANTEWTMPHQYNYRRLSLLHTALVSALRFQAVPYAFDPIPSVQSAIDEMIANTVAEEVLDNLAKSVT